MPQIPSLNLLLIPIAVALAVLAGFAAWLIRRRNLHTWLGAAIRQPLETRRHLRRVRAQRETHLLLCVADHFEPRWGGADDETARSRVAAWTEGYPAALGSFRDSDGRPPRHTFFYPIDEYDAEHVDAIADLCRQGFGEIEIHLHHDRDTASNLTRTLAAFTELFSGRHGLLGRWPDGRVAYGFVHGNWALDNARPDGRWCGVANELTVLRRTGCYADFTLPSAPDITQTRTVNQIYWARGRDGCCKSHDRGVRVGQGPAPEDGLMIVQGPLRLWWPKGSRMLRIENGCLQAGQGPSMARLEQWIRAGVHVPQRPDWTFVKLHTHGAIDANRRVLLGPSMARFHRELAALAEERSGFRYHYVTAREMYNLARAAEAGWTGNVANALEFEVSAPRAEIAAMVRNPREYLD
jgi:hypothetical protein